MKMPLAPSGIEHKTFRFVEQTTELPRAPGKSVLRDVVYRFDLGVLQVQNVIQSEVGRKCNVLKDQKKSV